MSTTTISLRLRISFGSSLGVRASRLWLLELLYTFLLIYGVIETLYIMGFDVLLPGLLKEHYEKFHDPTSLREYPFATPLPTISTFYLALSHGDELGGTQVGAHCLGTVAPAKKAPQATPRRTAPCGSRFRSTSRSSRPRASIPARKRSSSPRQHEPRLRRFATPAERRHAGRRAHANQRRAGLFLLLSHVAAP